jgi:hypothetical protein
VLIADARKVKGLAPLACKTDKIDARVLAVLSERDLVHEIWLPDPAVRREREQARFRLHRVKHRSMLKLRIDSTLITFGKPCPVPIYPAGGPAAARPARHAGPPRRPATPDRSAGRRLLDRLEISQPWRGSVDASLALIDDLERQIAEINRQLRAGGGDHPSVAAHGARDLASPHRTRRLTAAPLIEPSSTARHSGPPSAVEWMTGTPPASVPAVALPGTPNAAHDRPLTPPRSFMDDAARSFKETSGWSAAAIYRPQRWSRFSRKALSAPSKKFVWSERCGDEPFVDESAKSMARWQSSCRSRRGRRCTAAPGGNGAQQRLDLLGIAVGHFAAASLAPQQRRRGS